jgi:hypothetical protein
LELALLELDGGQPIGKAGEPPAGDQLQFAIAIGGNRPAYSYFHHVAGDYAGGSGEEDAGTADVHGPSGGWGFASSFAPQLPAEIPFNGVPFGGAAVRLRFVHCFHSTLA